MSARLEKANEALNIIAKYGRHFFKYKNRVAQFETDNKNKVWFRDHYSDKLIWCYREDLSWRGFTCGGTMKSLITSLHKFVTKGELVPPGHLGPWPEWYCAGDLWGYGNDMENVRNEIKELGILK